MEVVFWLAVVIIVVVAVAVWGYIKVQGDTNIKFLAEQKTNFVLHEINENSATFLVKVPFVNKGKQDGIILDAFSRHQLPSEQYDAVSVRSRMTLEANPREDDYWEAVIIPKFKGGAVNVYVSITAKRDNLEEALGNMVDMPIDLIYEEVGRGPWQYRKARIIMTNADIKQVLKSRAN